jgi:hypothetical protein
MLSLLAKKRERDQWALHGSDIMYQRSLIGFNAVGATYLIGDYVYQQFFPTSNSSVIGERQLHGINSATDGLVLESCGAVGGSGVVSLSGKRKAPRYDYSRRFKRSRVRGMIHFTKMARRRKRTVRRTFKRRFKKYRRRFRKKYKKYNKTKLPYFLRACPPRTFNTIDTYVWPYEMGRQQFLSLFDTKELMSSVDLGRAARTTLVDNSTTIANTTLNSKWFVSRAENLLRFNNDGNGTTYLTIYYCIARRDIPYLWEQMTGIQDILTNGFKVEVSPDVAVLNDAAVVADDTYHNQAVNLFENSIICKCFKIKKVKKLQMAPGAEFSLKFTMKKLKTIDPSHMVELIDGNRRLPMIRKGQLKIILQVSGQLGHVDVEGLINHVSTTPGRLLIASERRYEIRISQKDPSVYARGDNYYYGGGVVEAVVDSDMKDEGVGF